MSQSDSDAPPVKRQRTEEQLTRSEIWHADGSVVLQAETIQFRVHWSVLSLHSSFFRDLRDRPQAPGHPSTEGCPLIELNDSSRDLQHLLNALYDPSVHTCVFRTCLVPLTSLQAAVQRGESPFPFHLRSRQIGA